MENLPVVKIYNASLIEPLPSFIFNCNDEKFKHGNFVSLTVLARPNCCRRRSREAFDDL